MKYAITGALALFFHCFVCAQTPNIGIAPGTAISLDTFYLVQSDTNFFEVHETRYANGQSTVTTALVGNQDATVAAYTEALKSITLREKTDLAAIARLTAEKNRLLGIVQQVKNATGESPLDSLDASSATLESGEWYLIGAGDAIRVEFKRDGATLLWLIDTDQGSSIFLGESLRLNDYPKPGVQLDLFRKEEIFVSADGAYYLKNAAAGISEAEKRWMRSKGQETSLNRSLQTRNLKKFPPGDYRWDGKKLTAIPPKPPKKKKK